MDTRVNMTTSDNTNSKRESEALIFSNPERSQSSNSDIKVERTSTISTGKINAFREKNPLKQHDEDDETEQHYFGSLVTATRSIVGQNLQNMKQHSYEEPPKSPKSL